MATKNFRRPSSSGNARGSNNPMAMGSRRPSKGNASLAPPGMMGGSGAMPPHLSGAQPSSRRQSASGRRPSQSALGGDPPRPSGSRAASGIDMFGGGAPGASSRRPSMGRQPSRSRGMYACEIEPGGAPVMSGRRPLVGASGRRPSMGAGPRQSAAFGGVGDQDFVKAGPSPSGRRPSDGGMSMMGGDIGPRMTGCRPSGGGMMMMGLGPPPGMFGDFGPSPAMSGPPAISGRHPSASGMAVSGPRMSGRRPSMSNPGSMAMVPFQGPRAPGAGQAASSRRPSSGGLSGPPGSGRRPSAGGSAWPNGGQGLTPWSRGPHGDLPRPSGNRPSGGGSETHFEYEYCAVRYSHTSR
jgi:hypothetical protein